MTSRKLPGKLPGNLMGSKITGALRNTRKVYRDLPGDLLGPIIYRVFRERAPGPEDLTLGVQYAHLLAEDEISQGLPFEPVGKKTKLGWFVLVQASLRKWTPSALLASSSP